MSSAPRRRPVVLSYSVIVVMLFLGVLFLSVLAPSPALGQELGIPRLGNSQLSNSQLGNSQLSNSVPMQPFGLDGASGSPNRPGILVVANARPTGIPGSYRAEVDVFDAGTRELLHSVLPSPDESAVAKPVWPVFNGDGSRCCVIVDPIEGIFRGYAWDGTHYRHARDLEVGAGVVDLQITARGKRVVVLSRETNDPWDTAMAYLRVIDFDTFEIEATIPLGAPVEIRADDSLRTGQVAVDDEGFAYVAVERSQVRPVNLATQKLWDLYSPGRHCDTRIVDLKSFDGIVYTLCRGIEFEVASSCVDWVHPISGESGQVNLNYDGLPDLGLSMSAGIVSGSRKVIFIHGQRAIYVLDQIRHELIASIPIVMGSTEMAVSPHFQSLVLLYPGKSSSPSGPGEMGLLRFVEFSPDKWQLRPEVVALGASEQRSLLIVPDRSSEIIATMVPSLNACLLVGLDRFGRPISKSPQYDVLTLGGQPTFISSEN